MMMKILDSLKNNKELIFLISQMVILLALLMTQNVNKLENQAVIKGLLNESQKSIIKKMDDDNWRFNATLKGLQRNYEISRSNQNQTLENQKLIINLTNQSLDNQYEILTNFGWLATKIDNTTSANLNKTLFNRVTLVDTNKILRTLIEEYFNVSLAPFNASEFK